VTHSVLVEPVGSVTRMGILHEVASHTSGSLFRGDLPVAVLLNLRTNVADRGAQIGDTETRTSLVGGESLAAGKVVDDTALLGEGVARHNIESPN